jgi:hypothetical protein
MVKAKAVDYFKTISIPGVSKIVTTESYLFKLFWTLLVLLIFGFGIENISQAVADFYKYDKITNIERVNPENVTFPAITICTDGYSKENYINGLFTKSEKVYSTNFSLSKFLNSKDTIFYSFANKTSRTVDKHLDYLDSTHKYDMSSYDCIRFNGITNKNVTLFKASSTEDKFIIVLNNSYRQNEYSHYTLSSFFIYISDNSLKSFERIQYLQLDVNRSHKIEIEKESIEIKLPEPYNPCKKFSFDEPYYQMNCIKACTYKEIKNKYNCTFHFTLFTIKGLQQCLKLNFRALQDEFYADCLKECPLESCHSEKFTHQIKSEPGNMNTYFQFSFRDLSTLNITQIPKTDGFTFLNNIGGGLGLFMGIAFPNLIEFLQFIFEIFSIIIYQ